MKLKLVEPGYQTFTDHLAGVPFENGVSTRDLNEAEVRLIAANLRVEVVGGGSAGDNQRYVDLLNTPAPIERLRTQAEREAQEAGQGVESTSLSKPAFDLLSRETLEKLADEKGIKGLRDLIEERGYNIKGNKIAELIDRIMESQGQPAAQTDKGPDMNVELIDDGYKDL